MNMEKSEEEAIARHLSHDLLISSIIVVDDGLDVAAIVKSICPDSGACVCLLLACVVSKEIKHLHIPGCAANGNLTERAARSVKFGAKLFMSM